MTIIDRLKIARTAALAHEQAAHDLRVAAFAYYQIAGRSDDYSIFEAARSSHIAACEAVRKLENLAEEADLARFISSLNA
jgi:hypothetical protein